MNSQGYLYDATLPSRRIPIGELLVIGKNDQCQMQVNYAGTAERHCRIENKGDSYLIRDLRSGQPTYLNSTRISEAFLNEGDSLQIGEGTFIFSYEGAPKVSDFSIKSRSAEWGSVLKTLGNVSQTTYPVLLLGPSGTGKEVLAHAIHQHSTRATGPFVSVNCSALTETLIESELFGHVKGSFTGAIADRKGAFESARCGSLFLDEIGDLPYGLQAKLLRALENNEIRPVGSDRSINTDVRIIAATHQNLDEKIRLGQFREDLFFRINVLTVCTPALKDRMEDFEELLYTFAKKMRVPFSFGAVEKLKKHDWPGNIRELKNTVARASAYYPGVRIEEQHLEHLLNRTKSNETSHPPTSNDSELPVIKEIEKQMIIKRLAANRGNQRRTAADLNMPKSTLHDRLKFYQIDAKSFQPNPEIT
jgi:DNA-binding NtrC family response regulator